MACQGAKMHFSSERRDTTASSRNAITQPRFAFIRAIGTSCSIKSSLSFRTTLLWQKTLQSFLYQSTSFIYSLFKSLESSEGGGDKESELRPFRPVACYAPDIII